MVVAQFRSGCVGGGRRRPWSSSHASIASERRGVLAQRDLPANESPLEPLESGLEIVREAPIGGRRVGHLGDATKPAGAGRSRTALRMPV